MMGGVIWSRQTGHSRRVSSEFVSTVPSSRLASSTNTDCMVESSSFWGSGRLKSNIIVKLKVN